MRHGYIVAACMVVIAVGLPIASVATMAGQELRKTAAESQAAPPPTFDFRKCSWGMTPEQVKRSETAKLLHENDVRGRHVIAYSASVSGFDVLVMYVLVEGKLTRAKYVFLQEHSNKNNYIDDFGTVKDSLVEKYGRPKTDDTFWHNDLYKDQPEDWGLAVSIGHLSYYSGWETGSTVITLALTGDNYKVDLVLEYASKALQYLEKKADEKSNQAEY